jgi:hypothetical protein
MVGQGCNNSSDDDVAEIRKKNKGITNGYLEHSTKEKHSLDRSSDVLELITRIIVKVFEAMEQKSDSNYGDSQ